MCSLSSEKVHAASIRVRLLIKCGFYTRLYGTWLHANSCIMCKVNNKKKPGLNQPNLKMHALCSKVSFSLTKVVLYGHHSASES